MHLQRKQKIVELYDEWREAVGGFKEAAGFAANYADQLLNLYKKGRDNVSLPEDKENEDAQQWVKKFIDNYNAVIATFLQGVPEEIEATQNIKAVINGNSLVVRAILLIIFQMSAPDLMHYRASFMTRLMVIMIFKREKVVFISAGVIALVVSAVILALLLNIQAFKPKIEAAASNALGMDVRIRGRLGIVLFPDFGISLKDVSVRKKGADVVTVEKMRIGLRLIPLMRPRVGMGRIGLIKPVFSIVRYKNGKFNFEKPERTLMKDLLR